jgi:hypothetical protein
MKSTCRLALILFVAAILLSCGAEQQDAGALEAHAMEEALAMAADNNSAIVIEFWIDA